MKAISGGVKSARRVMVLLELLVSRGTPLTLREVAEALAIPKSSAHGLLTTLVTTGFLMRSSDGAYQLSMKWLALVSSALESASAVDSTNIRQVAYPVMLQLSKRLGMTCNLAVLNGHDVVYIDKVQDRSNSIQLSTHIGAALPAHATALGKALVADLGPADLDAWLETHDFRRLTPHTRASAAVLRADLEEARRRGYAIDDEESHLGVMCVGACLKDHAGRALAAISLTGMKAAIEAIGREPTGSEVRAAAAAISKGLGGAAAQAHVDDREEVRPRT